MRWLAVSLKWLWTIVQPAGTAALPEQILFGGNRLPSVRLRAGLCLIAWRAALYFGPCASAPLQSEAAACGGLQVFDMAVSTEQEAAGREVTGPEDPLRLRVSHTLDTSTLTLSVCLHAFNRLTAEVKGAAIK